MNKTTVLLGIAALVTTSSALANDGPAMCGGLEATIVGSAGPDIIMGTDGRDVIVSFGGNDYIDAGAGSDVVCAGAGSDTVIGGEGDDILFGEQGADNLFGDHGECFDIDDPRRILTVRSALLLFEQCDATRPGGEDYLSGGRGSDFLSGDEESDRILGGRGNDILFSGIWNHSETMDLSVIDRIWGADGEDRVVAYGNARIYGGNDNDHLQAKGTTGSLTRIFGDDGNDRISFSGPTGPVGELFEIADNRVQVYAGAGDDVALTVTDGSVTFYGGPGNDTFEGHEGTIGSLRAYGEAGNDLMGTGLASIGPAILDGGEGDDTLLPIEGNPLVVRGGEGNDTILGYGQANGGPGNDHMYVWERSEVWRGGSGDDLFILDRGSSTVKGNAGNDQFFIQPINGTLRFNGIVEGGPGADACNDSDGVFDCELNQTQAPFDPDPLFDTLNYFYD